MKIALLFAILLALVIPAAAQETSVVQDEAAQTAWREDVDFLLERLITIHPDPFFRTSEADMRAAADGLKADVPHLTDEQIVAELARITAMLDGHTYLFMLQDRAVFRQYPIRLYVFEEGIYVVNAPLEHLDLIGARLAGINGMDAQTVYETLAPYSSRDNEYNLSDWLPSLIQMPELLLATGIIDDLDQPNFEFELADGTTRIVQFRPITMHEYMRWNEGGMMGIMGLPYADEPLYLSNRHENFWYTLLEDRNTLYVQYNHVYSTGADGLRISHLAQQIMESDAERLIIDMRHNGGGDNTTYGSLLGALENSHFNAPGKLFVIMGRSTFSAAKDFVMDVSRRTEAIFVGEPTGGMPNNYGDTRMIRLPNSGIEVGIATTYVRKGDEDDSLPYLAPDIPVPPTAADFFMGRDAALEAILAYES